MATSIMHKISHSMPHHHPDEELLLDYATGATDEAEALMVAVHLSFCEECRRIVRDMEAIGSALMSECEALAPEMDADELLDRLEAADDRTESRRQAPAVEARAVEPWVPAPLRPYLIGDEPPKWRSVMRGLDEMVLPVSMRRARAKLLRIRAGAKMPEHTHVGTEHTIVLAGSFKDGDQRFGVGDVASSDREVTHTSVAGDEEDCICLTTISGDLRLTGPIGRFINPFVKF